MQRQVSARPQRHTRSAFPPAEEPACAIRRGVWSITLAAALRAADPRLGTANERSKRLPTNAGELGRRMRRLGKTSDQTLTAILRLLPSDQTSDSV